MLEHATSAVRYFLKHSGLLPAAALFLGLAGEFAAKALLGSILPQRARAPFRGGAARNAARLARFLCDISYFERPAQARGLRRFWLRIWSADLWSG
jgi:hypothetical protein